jgi:hypothetical protein
LAACAIACWRSAAAFTVLCGRNAGRAVAADHGMSFDFGGLESMERPPIGGLDRVCALAASGWMTTTASTAATAARASGPHKRTADVRVHRDLLGEVW